MGKGKHSTHDAFERARKDLDQQLAGLSSSDLSALRNPSTSPNRDLFGAVIKNVKALFLAVWGANARKKKSLWCASCETPFSPTAARLLGRPKGICLKCEKDINQQHVVLIDLPQTVENIVQVLLSSLGDQKDAPGAVAVAMPELSPECFIHLLIACPTPLEKRERRRIERTDGVVPGEDADKEALVELWLKATQQLPWDPARLAETTDGRSEEENREDENNKEKEFEDIKKEFQDNDYHKGVVAIGSFLQKYPRPESKYSDKLKEWLSLVQQLDPDARQQERSTVMDADRGQAENTRKATNLATITIDKFFGECHSIDLAEIETLLENSGPGEGLPFLTYSEEDPGSTLALLRSVLDFAAALHRSSHTMEGTCNVLRVVWDATIKNKAFGDGADHGEHAVDEDGVALDAARPADELDSQGIDGCFREWFRYTHHWFAAEDRALKRMMARPDIPAMRKTVVALLKGEGESVPPEHRKAAWDGVMCLLCFGPAGVAAAVREMLETRSR